MRSLTALTVIIDYCPLFPDGLREGMMSCVSHLLSIWNLPLTGCSAGALRAPSALMELIKECEASVDDMLKAFKKDHMCGLLGYAFEYFTARQGPCQGPTHLSVLPTLINTKKTHGKRVPGDEEWDYSPGNQGSPEDKRRRARLACWA